MIDARLVLKVTAMAALLSLVSAEWLVFVEGVRPCILCVTQQILLAAIAAVSVYGLANRRRRHRGALLGAAFLAAAGFGVVVYQMFEIAGAVTTPGVCTVQVGPLAPCAEAGAHRIFGIRLVDGSAALFAALLVAALWGIFLAMREGVQGRGRPQR